MSNPALLCDFYKLSHRAMYPKGTQYVYSTWTPRASRLKGMDEVVVFGLQAFLRTLQSVFESHFFYKRKDEVLADYSRMVTNALGVANPETQHLADLHDLGYLPLSFKALPEGCVVPLRCPARLRNS